MADPQTTIGSQSTATVGRVVLQVPAEPTMSRVARLTASAVASLAGCTIDQLEDIKIAVSEVLIALVEHGNGDSIDLTFVQGEGDFVVTGRTLADEFDTDNLDLRLCRTVLAGVCSSHSLHTRSGVAEISATVPITGH